MSNNNNKTVISINRRNEAITGGEAFWLGPRPENKILNAPPKNECGYGFCGYNVFMSVHQTYRAHISLPIPFIILRKGTH